MKHSNHLTVFAFLLILTGCASMGLQPAQSFDQKLAYAYGVHTAVLSSTAASVTSGALSKADGSAILAMCDQARALLDSARTVEAQDPSGASDKLALALSVLTQVQAYINSHSGSKS